MGDGKTTVKPLSRNNCTTIVSDEHSYQLSLRPDIEWISFVSTNNVWQIYQSIFDNVSVYGNVYLYSPLFNPFNIYFCSSPFNAVRNEKMMMLIGNFGLIMLMTNINKRRAYVKWNRILNRPTCLLASDILVLCQKSQLAYANTTAETDLA